MNTNMTRLSTGFLAGTNLVLNRFTGPGRVGLQCSKDVSFLIEFAKSNGHN